MPIEHDVKDVDGPFYQVVGYMPNGGQFGGATNNVQHLVEAANEDYHERYGDDFGVLNWTRYQDKPLGMIATAKPHGQLVVYAITEIEPHQGGHL